VSRASPSSAVGASDAGGVGSPKHAKHEVPVNPYAAFRQVVYRYGVPELADELGLPRGTLYNKADAHADSHHQPTMRDVINVTRLTGDELILESLDRLFGRIAIHLPDASVTSDEALLEILCRCGKENGDLHAAVLEVLQQKHITRDALVRVRYEVLGFVHRLEGLVDD
jgi:hypothetical protein